MGDFNLDLLKFELHKPTEEFIDAMFSYGLIPTLLLNPLGPKVT